MEYVIDAANERLGRLASEIASVLQGKRHPSYHPRLRGSDRVLVKNISKITVGGTKYHTKVYYRHTGYMGHLRRRTYRESFERDPREVLFFAVLHMLPKNKLRTGRMKRLVIES